MNEDAEVQAMQNDPQFLQMIQQNPELLQQIQENPDLLRQLYQDYTGQQRITDEQMETANALRNQEGPQGRQAGNQYVAANPLEHLSSMGSKALAQKQYYDNLELKKKLSDDKTRGLSTVALSEMQQKPNQQMQQQQQQAELLRRMQQGQMAGGQS